MTTLTTILFALGIGILIISIFSGKSGSSVSGGCCGGAGHTDHSKSGNKDKKIDPVCNMEVDPDTAKHVSEIDGEKTYFCSSHCKDKFDSNPERFLNSDGNHQHATGGCH